MVEDKMDKKEVWATSKGQGLLKQKMASLKNQDGKFWTFGDLAATAGVNERTARRFINGERSVKERTALAICNALGLAFTEIAEKKTVKTGQNRTEIASSYQPEVEELLSILQRVTEQERSLLKPAYEDCCRIYCPAGFNLPFTTDLGSLLNYLAKMPQGAVEYNPMARFVAYLVKRLPLQSEQRQHLNNWGNAQTSEFNRLIDELQIDIEGTRKTYYLMIQVKPRMQKAGYYSVAASLSVDLDPFSESDVEQKESLLSDDMAKEELPSLLLKLLDICHDREIALSDLMIQWFLPTNLLDMEVDQFLIPIGKQELPIATQCQIVVRSGERQFSLDYHPKKNDWKKRWRLLTQILHLSQ
ncbi:MAG: hypothetical protein SFW36_06790 [Leptolyngbyaceae cyanobacterium bins.59]|nr:hypothetical protein [Leptolyngbyaceae cyanobacterium bins.59]